MTCPLCTDRAKSEIWRNGNFYLIDAEDPAFPCFLRVVSCRHVPEMSSLTSEERTELWGILNVVEEEIIKALRPHKVNLAQFGTWCRTCTGTSSRAGRTTATSPNAPGGRCSATFPQTFRPSAAA